ncbi:MAG: hypothetical protein IKU10_00375, partial [Clostridia bacterium]|nr:hypothetical protein [Clostridia bacterium]
NVMDFAYYYNIFQPDCVVFEVAEYTFTEGYFSRETMQQMELNVPRTSVDSSQLIIAEEVAQNLRVEQGKKLAKLYYTTDTVYRSAWLTLDKDYDMKVYEQGYVVTVPADVYETHKDKLFITFQK